MSATDKMLAYLGSAAFREAARGGDGRAPQPFITISRQAGASGTSLGEAILAEMGRRSDPLWSDWRLLDRRLCEQVAQDPELSVIIESLVNEVFRSPMEDYLSYLIADTSPQTSVIPHICKIIRAAAKAGRVIIVGRAANLVTRHMPLGVHVRLVASKSYRANRLKLRFDCGTAEAERRMNAMDDDRRRLVESCFHQDIDDPLLYDAVLNVEKNPPEALARMIVAMVERKAASVAQLIGQGS